MSLHSLNVFFKGSSPPAQPGTGLAGLRPAPVAGSSWAEVLAGFDAANASPGRASAQVLPDKLQHSVRTENGTAALHGPQQAGAISDPQQPAAQPVAAETLAAQIESLFAALEAEMPPGLNGDHAAMYSAEFWPSPGEMILLLQGVSPWGETLQPEQAAWLEQVGPWLGVPALERSYEGATELGRDMTAVNLADAAGIDLGAAFVDAWLGRHDPRTSRAAYEVRWAFAGNGDAVAQEDQRAELMAALQQLMTLANASEGPDPEDLTASIDSLRDALAGVNLSSHLLKQFEGLLAQLDAGTLPAPADPDTETLLSELRLELTQPGQQPAMYNAEFWPNPGEMLLLLQGVSPWGETLEPEQTAWLEQVGPWLGVPALERSYAGETAISRDTTVVNLAENAGADARRALFDAWLGRHDPQAGRAAYEQRWAQGNTAAPVPAPAAGVSQSLAALTLASRVAEPLSPALEIPSAVRDALPLPERGSGLQSLLTGNWVANTRALSATAARTDTAMLQAPAGALARDFAPLSTGLAALQPQSASAELRAAAEQAVQRVVWMAARQQGVSEARLQLHPAHLGKLDIRLELQGREASVQLTVHHAAVREAVEAMLPRLREQLEGQGLSLGDASVFDSSADEKTDREDARLAARGGDSDPGEDEAVAVGSRQQIARDGSGLLDAYA